MKDKFKILNNISKTEKKSFGFMKFSLVLNTLLSIFAIFYIFKTNESVKNRYYILDNGQKIATVRVKEFRKAVDILCEGHIKLFHKLFFSIEPDMKYIKKNIEEKALYLIDKSGTKIYNDLLNDEYYKSIVMSRYNIEVEIDKIDIDYNVYPYKFKLLGKQKISYDREVSYRNLITEGYIEETAITPNNLNGLKILNFRIKDNENIDN